MSNAPTLPTVATARALYLANLPIGATLQNGGSVVVEHKTTKSGDLRSVVVKRLKTGSTVSVSVAMAAKTLDRLRAGEAIERRTVSYTVTVEAAVIAGLGSAVRVSDGRYVLA